MNSTEQALPGQSSTRFWPLLGWVIPPALPEAADPWVFWLNRDVSLRLWEPKERRGISWLLLWKKKSPEKADWEELGIGSRKFWNPSLPHSWDLWILWTSQSSSPKWDPWWGWEGTSPGTVRGSGAAAQRLGSECWLHCSIHTGKY